MEDYFNKKNFLVGIKENLFTFSNLVTTGGIIVGLFLLSKSNFNFFDIFWVFLIFCSDILDGFIARMRKEETIFGYFLDRIIRDTIVVLLFIKTVSFTPSVFSLILNEIFIIVFLEVLFLLFNIGNFFYHLFFLESDCDSFETKNFWFFWKVKQGFYFLIIFLVLFF